MDQILEQIEKLKSEIISAKTDTAEALESFRTRFLGTKGLVKSLMGEMKNVPAEQKKEFGQVMNAFKQFAEEKYESLRSSVTNGELSGKPATDLSMPGDPLPAGEFLVDASGTVRWVNLTANYWVRARPDQMIAVAKALR